MTGAAAISSFRILAGAVVIKGLVHQICSHRRGIQLNPKAQNFELFAEHERAVYPNKVSQQSREVLNFDMQGALPPVGGLPVSFPAVDVQFGTAGKHLRKQR